MMILMRRFPLFRSIRLLRSVFATVLLLPLVARGEEVAAEQSYRDAILQLSPMGTSELDPEFASILQRLDGAPVNTETERLDPELAKILAKYYDRSFGGSAYYQEVESIRFEGMLRLPVGAVHFIGFKKKPDYCKIVVLLPDEGRYIMSYDGLDAWQLDTTQGGAPADMLPGEALNFIRDASFGGPLMYPTLPGKRIELLGTVGEGEARAYDIEVRLPDGQKVRQIIDLARHKLRQQIQVNAVTGATEVITHTHHRDIRGLTIPFQSVMTSNGEFAHEVRLIRAEINIGVMPWMFTRPSGDYIPGLQYAEPTPDPLSRPAEDGVDFEPMSAFAAEQAVGSYDLGAGWFDSPLSSVDETRFPSLAPEEVKSILEEIGRSADP